jgi:hypothetical protein
MRKELIVLLLLGLLALSLPPATVNPWVQALSPAVLALSIR